VLSLGFCKRGGGAFLPRVSYLTTLLSRVLPSLLPSIACLAYMMMALNEGMFLSANGTFPVLWIRSVDYILATPLLLIDLGLLAGAQMDEIFLICTCDVVMIATGYWCVSAPFLRTFLPSSNFHPNEPHTFPPHPCRAGRWCGCGGPATTSTRWHTPTRPPPLPSSSPVATTTWSRWGGGGMGGRGMEGMGRNGRNGVVLPG
jgi:hypothetical protein